MGAIRFEPGERVRLVSSRDPWARARPGDEGTVLDVSEGAVRVAWDSGWAMPMYPGPGGDELERLDDATSITDSGAREDSRTSVGDR